MTQVLEINNLSKHYGRIKAVDELSMTVESGQVFGILGPNGSGKTTTLGLILDVINKTTGSYRWFGKPPSKENRKTIGAVLETPIFYPYLSAVKNLQIVALIKGVSYDKINPVLERVGLFERRHYRYRTYSLGMKQRLSIASALLGDPRVMILDEPTNGLDPEGIAYIRNLIIDIGREGKTIILASHLLDEVQKVCTHFAVLKNGRKIHSGPVEEVSRGTVTVEIASHESHLEELLKTFPNQAGIKQNGDLMEVHLTQGADAADLNRFLVDKGVVLSHLVTKKKSLEKQFLEILKGSE